MAEYNAMSDILATDLIKALWEDARRETDPKRKAQLERDAQAMEDVWSRSKYALAPTRDQMTAALGNASLNLADTLSAVASGLSQVRNQVSQIHTDVQNNDTLISTFIQEFPQHFAALQADLRQAVGEETARGLGKFSEDIDVLKQGQIAYNERLDQVISRLDADEERFDERLDRKRERLDEHDQAIAELREVSAQHAQIIADRAEQRKAEYAQLVEEIVRRLQGDGNA